MAFTPMAGGRADPACTNCKGKGTWYPAGSGMLRPCACISEAPAAPVSPGETLRAAERSVEACKVQLAQAERLTAEARAALPEGTCAGCYGTRRVLLPGGMFDCPACKPVCATCKGTGKVTLNGAEYGCPAKGCGA